jgi:hypothetical protein
MYIITVGKEWDDTGGFNYQHGLHNQKWWKLQSQGWHHSIA